MRVAVLNRWWTGLLEMLKGRNGESVTGSDRPTILEAVTSIMIRPEWSMPFQFGRQQSSSASRPLLNSRSTSSLGSTSSDYLADSVRKVRHVYVQNLLSQMGYVVEKMSSRNVPASVVAFCGKATAFAFFHCEGVADILVRLWAPTQETIRRALAEHPLRKNVDLKDSSDSIATHFPSALRGLAFKSTRLTIRYLRSRPQLPLVTARIPWHGPWVGRWAGRDTDLLFGFVKCYYHLLNKFLPSDASPEETLCAPGYLLIQAQILTVLDSVIKGGNGQTPLDPLFAPSLHYDELLGEADATASVLPFPPAITNRSLAEHRLISLLRDSLSGSALGVGRARELFAESFERLLKATARRTSLFNHSACFALCDLMEEALAILVRYESSAASSAPSLDWSFWLQVCRQMMDSQNTMTEIRMYAFLYSLWNTVTAEENRKRQICLEWLLDEKYFQEQFNHWCPMVRAYYMRLLCWRLGQPSETRSELDIRIMRTLALRLYRVWEGFLSLQADTLGKGGPRISTAPCSPAPCRRLLIIRSDSQPSPGGMFLTFDSILSPSSPTVATAYERHGSIGPINEAEESQESRIIPSVGKKSWSLLKNIMPFAVSTLDTYRSTDKQQGMEKAKTADSAVQTKLHGPRSSKKSTGGHDTAFRVHSFRFSLEWIDGEKSLFGKERQLYQPRLPYSTSDDLFPHDATEYSPGSPEPVGVITNQGKYAGRALAEWDLLVDEYRDFSMRRLAQGVPRATLVETPTLGVETFRRTG
ncbi:MAG: hypothetical protein Q9177_004616 [Variospora cf. flavescens]